MATKKPVSRPITNRMKRRLNIFVALFLLLFILYIVANLFSLSVVKADEMREFAASQQMKSLEINANRGTIYDTNMEILAQSSTVWTVAISPKTIDEETKPIVAQELAAILEMDYETVLAKTQKTNGFEYVKKKLTKPVADQVRKLITEKGYNFITLQEDTKRYYPKETLAAQVLGFTNADNKGQYGIEQQYDNTLSGTSGKILTATDANGDIIPTSYEKQFNATDGNSLVLTLDATIQHFAEKALDELVAIHNPKGGACAIVMNVKTGAILAMANNPTFDLNQPAEIYSPLYQEELNNPTKLVENEESANYEQVALTDEEKAKLQTELMMKQWGNKSISWLYQPGSVFKIVTAAAALETGVQTLDSTFSCGGSINIAGTVYHCWKRAGHGPQNFTQMVANSCNPAFINMGQMLGIDNFFRFLSMFGMTEPTGIDMFGEASRSIYVPKEKMSVVDLASESFGQTMAVTPLQMITAAAAAVNGGYLVQPYVVDEILDSDGNVIEKKQPTTKRQVISEQKSAELNTTLEAMVKGSIVDIKGYRVGGKSGTSQIGNKSDGRYVGSFVGVAPINDPEIAVLVAVDEPRGTEYYGSKVAGAALASILEDTLNHLGVAPEYSQDDLNSSEVTVPNLLNADVAAAQASLAEVGMTAQVKGAGTTIVDQMPQGGVSAAKGSKVILYTEAVSEPEMVTVPDVLGMTLAAANKALTDAGLNISLDSGDIVGDQSTISVVSQSVTGGVSVPIGTAVSVSYAKEIVDLPD